MVRHLNHSWWEEAFAEQKSCPAWLIVVRLRLRAALVDQHFTSVTIQEELLWKFLGWAGGLPSWNTADPPISWHEGDPEKEWKV